MPKPPPRSLCLPDIVADPQARADFVAANPPRHSPSHSRTPSISDTASSSPIPPSPTSTNSHRASAATLSSLASPLATASTRTSLSVHNLSWGNDTKRGSGLSGIPAKTASVNDSKGWSFASLIDSSEKARSSWSNTFSGSWFGGPSAASEPSSKSSNPKEIKLSPSMIAAVASEETTPKSARPMSFPLTATTQRKPRVGTGLQYYTERNPAPPNSRFQISESESPTSPNSLAPPTPVIVTERASSPNNTPTRPPLEGDSALPDIRVSSG